MSIDPLQMVRQVMAAKLRQTETGPNVPGGKSFADTLNSLESQGKEAESSQSAARAVAQLAQLRMLQGLFHLEDESDDGTGFFDAFRGGGLAAVPTGASQKVDKVYARLQPTLQDQGKDSQNDIDRLIDRVASQVSLAPELIRSVVAAESDFQPDAISPAGAQGLMQLMPETAKELGVEDSFDPHQNLLGGSQYLKQLLDKYGGDLDHALAAYNWGQGNVDRHGLERMPQETREYLARVKAGLMKTRA